MSDSLEPRYVEVYLHDQHIGWICEAGRVTRFVPSEDFIANPDRPTLSISITVPGHEGITQEVLKNPFDPAIYRERGELPPFFAGLLPEGDLRKRLEATRHHPRDRDDFGILAAAGEDLPGAVKIIPANLDRLTWAARTYGVTGGADNLEISVPERAAEGAASLSGQQNKIALSKAHDGKRYTLPVAGKLSDLIAKLPLPNDDEQIFNEYAAMQLAALAGVNTAACKPRPMVDIALPELVEALGEKTHFLAVDRFDHTPGGVVHTEDACQALGRMPNEKYATEKDFITFLGVIDRLSIRGIEDVRQFFIRQTVNTLIGNSDAHLKNFSFIYYNGKRPELSPAYDIVCVAALPGFKGYQLNVAIDNKQQQETLQTYRDIANAASISYKVAVAAVRSAVERAQDLWPKALEDLNVPASMKKVVTRRLESLPLANLKSRL